LDKQHPDDPSISQKWDDSKRNLPPGLTIGTSDLLNPYSYEEGFNAIKYDFGREVNA
jgi:hypothetical protein